MDRQESRPFKEKLLSLRAHLHSDVRAKTTVVVGSTGHADREDRSWQPSVANEDDSRGVDSALHAIAREKATLIRIERALERIEDGEYGECQNCRRLISKRRLRVLPYAELCMQCVSRLEPIPGRPR